ncbi:hypothetical protein DPMN_026371 [Dreissena polymorpha]|uniref:Uncharacterized protein n=1 Tax=Dreissena polymorpha TaxID=45954 RepID=A0A9D4RCI8_DREPO|nr:hypothetical protein DPMN_026371 [Dreissena polymorpha]
MTRTLSWINQTLKNPVYDVKRNDPRARRVRRLHRNLFLPLRQTDGKPSDIVLDDVATAGTKYVIPHKRGKYTPSADVNPEVRRSTRNRRAPKWQTNGQFQM